MLADTLLFWRSVRTEPSRPLTKTPEKPAPDVPLPVTVRLFMFMTVADTAAGARRISMPFRPLPVTASVSNDAVAAVAAVPPLRSTSTPSAPLPAIVA